MRAAPERAGLGALATLAALALAWGFNWPFMKIVFAEFPVWTFRGASGLTAGIAVLALARLTGGRIRPEGTQAWIWLWVGAFLNVTVWQVTTGYGVQLLGSGHAAVLAFTMPLWAGLVAWVALGEKMTGPFATALAMAMAGVALLSFRGGSFASSDIPGIALMLAAALAWAIGTLHAKHPRSDLPVLATVGWQIALGSLPIAMVAPVIEPLHWPQASLAAWGAAAYVTAVAMVVGYVAWFRLVDILPASVASLSTIAIPATAMLSGAAILGEAMGPREIAALGLMLGALALALIVPALLPKRPAAPN